MTLQWKPVWADVRRILLAEWDPIGAYVPEDEYDATVGPVVSMLFRNATPQQIANYLEHEAAGYYGCPMPRERHEQVAMKLTELSIPNE